MLFVALCVLVPETAHGQDGVQPTVEPQGAFPAATFETVFRKLTLAKNTFSPYYSWDALMALDLTVFRQGPSAVEFTTVFQTVGTENLGERVGVGGTGYIIRAAYVRRYSENLVVSAGIGHLSSHLTRDLDAKTDEQRREGEAIPKVADSDEYNVFFVKGQVTLTHIRFTPRVSAILQPLNFRFDGSRARYVRPLFLSSRSILRRRGSSTIALETQHELGRRPFNRFALVLELFDRDRAGGRFQVFLAGSPGHGMHVSPNVGGLRDGIAVGLRMRFRG